MAARRPELVVTQPMLAAKVEDVGQLRFPLIATPKLDGIRCVVQGGRAYTRKLKLVPNDSVRARLEQLIADGWPSHVFDGELMLADRRATFQDVSSAIMSHDGEPDFVFHVFDVVGPDDGLSEPYESRLDALDAFAEDDELPGFFQVVPHELVYDLAGLERYEGLVLAEGFEGVCLRRPDGPYKLGRSTLKAQDLLKLKRFVDAEAVIIGFDEQEANTNARTTDETGHAKRSQAKAGKVGKGTLGAFIVEAVEALLTGPDEDPLRFRIGTGVGLTAALRQEIWDHRVDYVGRLVKYRYQAQGTKDAPRIPSFIGFRDPKDT